MHQRKFGLAIFQMRGQIGDLAAKLQRLLIQLQARRVSPAGQPLQKFEACEHECLCSVSPVRIRFAEPLNEFPIRGRKKLLLMRRAGGQFNDFGQGAYFFPGARTEQIQLHRQSMKGGVIFRRLHLTDHPQRGAG